LKITEILLLKGKMAEFSTLIHNFVEDGIFTPSEIKDMVDLGLKSEKEIEDMIKEKIPESIFKLFFGKEDK
jgi:polyhydroxyalkanoate synthesis regulator phasin